MLRQMCKSKIHRATLTFTALHYAGSIAIDRALMEAADLLEYERVQVLNLNTGARLETYVVAEEAGSGKVGLLGPAARLGEAGDLLIIISYCALDNAEARAWNPTVVHVDAENRLADPA